MYICIEGPEGVGKTTQTKKLVEWLTKHGFRVLQTKEPGTPLSPLTMTLRALMLDNQYQAEMTPLAREFISQAIRSIHLAHVVTPALGQVDFIVQDRGILSGFAYGTACGNEPEFLYALSQHVVRGAGAFPGAFGVYDMVIYLRGDPLVGLARAQAAKQEFAAGDAMELQGCEFMKQVVDVMDKLAPAFEAQIIQVDGKTEDQVLAEICACITITRQVAPEARESPEL